MEPTESMGSTEWSLAAVSEVVAAAVPFLLSGRASYVTGALVDVDGGTDF